MAKAAVVLVVLVALVVVGALLIGTALIRPRSRWWQAMQNRAHSRRPGPGGPRFP